MPQVTKNAPDWQDVYNLIAAIGEDYNERVEFTTEVRCDYVQTIARAYAISGDRAETATHQALSRRALRQPGDMAVVCHTLAFDLWCQLDGAGATAARRSAPSDWRGRPIVPRRRN